MFRLSPILLAFLAVAQPVLAQQSYQNPPDPITRILDAPPLPLVAVSPDRTNLVLIERTALPTIEEVSAPELRLAGLRLDPRNSGPSRTTSFVSYRLQPVAGGAEQVIRTPAGARLGFPIWEPSGRRFAFTITEKDAIRLWVADATTGEARLLTDRPLHATGGGSCSWMPDGTALLCRLVPRDRATPPAQDATPLGPAVQEGQGRTTPNRTYQDLLKGPVDENLFEFYSRNQLAIIDLTGNVREIGAPGFYISASPAPGGQFLLIQEIHRPWSYVVPAGRFPRRISVWTPDGKLVRELADLPLQDDIPADFDAVGKGMRSVSWQSGAPATLVWAVALDQGDPRVAAAKRDQVFRLEAPFTGEPVSVAQLEYRYAGTNWLPDGRMLLTESWWKTRRTRTWLLGDTARIVFDRNSEDRYADPGNLVTVPGRMGSVVLTTPDGRSAFLFGQGASAEGDRPFVDRLDLASGKTTRLWRSEAPYYEEPVALLDPAGRRILTRRESVSEVPNYMVRDTRNNQSRALTRFSDPAPEFAGLAPELITYRRADGVELSGKLYLPPGYVRTQGPLPFFFWAYPQEFKSAAAASQVQGSPYRFVRPSGPSHLFLLTQGYGILDGPAMPIVGEGDKQPNDTYIEQLVSSAEAAVNKVVDLGVADRQRIAVGGHSYGAFMTGNLLAHSDLFRTGIARSGAYNRTLTPFGFQAEERTFWEAGDTYNEMSPFTYANKINEPILLIHGEADNNSGTFPIQSERMYAAITGNGGTARLVMLPAESHGYAARESVGHVLWEMVAWLDRWVKQRTLGTF
jgi:dipeptidyl aminopeptidase/acylaminoacyl peptidase